VSDENRNKVALIADKTTATGFRLAGIPVVRELEAGSAEAGLEDAINDLLDDEDIKFVITTEPLVEAFGIEKFEKLRKALPPSIILSVIPDRAGSRSKVGEEHLRQLIRRAIGAKRI
jgi:vacuolar-type H+-ATPase subunit F/Vma7